MYCTRDGFPCFDWADRRIDPCPVQLNCRVEAVDQHPSAKGYILKITGKTLAARYVVIATGFFQKLVVPAFTERLPEEIVQLHTGQYRNPQLLPPGAILVVGSAQSGSPITEELYLSGRIVYLSVGRAGGVPRRYRGRDVWDWLNRMGFLDRTVEHPSRCQKAALRQYRISLEHEVRPERIFELFRP